MQCVRLFFTAATPAGLARMAAAQTDSARVAAAAAQAKQKLGLIVYPAKGQTPQQQALDEQQCYSWAQQQTDPLAKSPSADSAAQAGKTKADSAAQGAAVKGAAGGALGGAAVGAAAGDAGRGARVGAVAGAIRGRRAKKQAEQQAEQQGRAQAQAQAGQQANTFKRAMVACLQGRGYSVQ
jgi:hypothetical protein